MHGGTAFFMTVPELSDLKIENAMFDADRTIWQRMLAVDLLVLDDLGSEHTKAWGRSLVERVIRLRSNQKRSVVCTTNRADKLDTMYGESMMAVFGACILPVKVDGTDWRVNETENLHKAIMGDT